MIIVGFDRSHCREPIKTVFHDVFDQNKDGILSNSELQEMYEIGNEAPCINQFFKNCSGGKETFTEAEFCNCFSSVGEVIIKSCKSTMYSSVCLETIAQLKCTKP